MSVAPDYDEVVTLYIRVIKEDSPAAAALFEEIRITCGARAALRAGLAMTLVKIEDQSQRPIPDVSTYAYMLVDYPLALSLLEQAIQCWIKDRYLRKLALGLRPNSDTADSDTEAIKPASHGSWQG